MQIKCVCGHSLYYTYRSLLITLCLFIKIEIIPPKINSYMQFSRFFLSQKVKTKNRKRYHDYLIYITFTSTLNIYTYTNKYLET